MHDTSFRIACATPAVLSVNFGCNEPRLATLRSKRAAKSKPLVTYTNAELGFAAEEVGIKGSPTVTVDSFQPETKRSAKMLTGTPAELAKQLYDLIEEEKGKQNGICVYAESYNGELETVAAELVSAAKGLAETTKEKVQAIVLSDHAEELVKELDKLGVDEIYAVKADHDITLQDDAVSAAIAEMLKKIEPSAVLVPATPQGRSIFSRVAMRLGCGMTADCTEVLAAQREDGSFYIKQNKPSYGENVFVTILTKEGIYPQMMTVRPGVYAACEAKESGNANVTFFDDIKIEKSGVEILEELPAENTTDSILGAEVVVVGGRGVLEDDNFELLEKFAEKVGGAIGGTRPMVDSEMIPFNHQIGQTGLTIRPKICISFGVSGAIQHTEGIKDTNLYVAVNTDENAAIFGVADYGIQADLKEILENYLTL